MQQNLFHDGWTCRHLGDPGPGRSVSIPHDAMISESRSELSAGGVNTGWYEGYDYLYEKTFVPGPEVVGQKTVLEFEGVYHNAEVSLNGESLMFRPYGYTNFYVDLTGKLLPGQENLLQVIARNADQPNSRWYSGAGIYRPVRLWTGPADAHILLNGLRIRTLSIQPASIAVTVLTQGDGPVRVEVRDSAGNLAASGEARAENGKAVLTLSIPDASLWSPDSPALYLCHAFFGADTASSTFGIRTLSWGRHGILLNGSRIIIQGACIHHDNGVLGARCYEDAEWRKIRLMKENGYNAIRSAHNPCSKYLLDACDHLGILVMDEYIDHWYIHKTEHDYVTYFNDWWRQDLPDMVEKDYNHPSVILYSTGNEVSETAQKKGIALTRQLTDFLHGLDDSRPVTCGINIFFNFLSSVGFGVYSDEKAKKEAQKAEKRKADGKPKKEKAVGSKFFNDMAGLLGDEFMKRGATIPPCDWRTKDAFAQMDIAGYNYGIYRYRHDLKKYPSRLILGSETFCNDAYKFRELAKVEPRLVGDFVWAGMDYMGEVMVGSWEYSDYAPRFDGGLGWVTAGSGRVDLTGRPLCEALYTRVALEQDKGPFLGVCPVNHTGDKHSPSAWKMSNAIDSWSWHGYSGNKADVEVYARAASVELKINGRSVGRKALKNDCIARFRCVYEDGTIEAISFDASGNELGRASLKTASSETRLQAIPGRLAFIRLKYTDNAGILKPLERGILKVSVQGGTLAGLGSACPFNAKGFAGSETDTYYGEALAVVKADSEGPVTLSVSDGTLSCSVSIPVRTI